MEELAIYATMTARPGKEEEAEAILDSLSSYAEAETGTRRWFALKGHDRTFAIFDTFEDKGSRTAHLEGQLAQELFRRSPDLFENGPQVVLLEILPEKH